MSEPETDIQQLRGSSALRRFLDDLRDDGHIAELADGYRLCIATACAFHREPDVNRSRQGRQTMFAPTTLDTPDFALRTALSEIFPAVSHVPYRAAEDLAEQGAEILKEMYPESSVQFADLLERIENNAS